MTLGLLEAVTEGGLRFAGFADNEARHETRWQKIADALGPLLFRWPAGCIEQNIIEKTPIAQLEALLTDPEDEKTGMRLRTLATRLGIEQKDFPSISSKAGSNLAAVMIDAATGRVPPERAHNKSERKEYEKHAQTWFKTLAGGRELEEKLFTLGLWPAFKDQLLPFCNALRKAVDLPEVADLAK